LTLVLGDGSRYRLPNPPPGEGRLGVMLAMLSPDGRWLGHRRASFDRDPTYRLRDLGGTGSVEFDGVPVAWSANSRYLLARTADLRVLRIEPARHQVLTLPRDATRAVAVLPDGRVVFGAGDPGHVRLTVNSVDPTGSTTVDIPLPDRSAGYGWALGGGPTLTVSPDGTWITLPLRYETGKDPATGLRLGDHPDGAVAFLRAEVAGDRSSIVECPGGGNLVGDTGVGLLVARPGLAVVLDAGTGAEVGRTTLPAGTDVALPGQILYTGE
jgi:hypothetical protein